ncbi:MAG: DsbA family protein [Alphaproteobacteria bacterium]
MQNIWAWVVGIVLSAGAGIAIYSAFDSGEERRMSQPVRQETPVAAQTALATSIVAPKPAETFSEVPIRSGELFLGKQSAPITIVEYASKTCPHCANFHSNVLPTIKKEYIDTGKVRLVYRDFPLDQLALRAAMVARCTTKDRYFGFVSTIFATQNKWARDSNPIAALARIALLGGMSQADFDACMKNQKVADAILNLRLEGDKTYHVTSTPTIIIGGEKYDGGLTVDQMRAVLNKQLKN